MQRLLPCLRFDPSARAQAKAQMLLPQKLLPCLHFDTTCQRPCLQAVLTIYTTFGPDVQYVPPSVLTICIIPSTLVYEQSSQCTPPSVPIYHIYHLEPSPCIIVSFRPCQQAVLAHSLSLHSTVHRAQALKILTTPFSERSRHPAVQSLSSTFAHATTRLVPCLLASPS